MNKYIYVLAISDVSVRGSENKKWQMGVHKSIFIYIFPHTANIFREQILIWFVLCSIVLFSVDDDGSSVERSQLVSQSVSCSLSDSSSANATAITANAHTIRF